MLGNDVVDLRDPDSNPESHPGRFDERVYSPSERRMIEDNPGSPSLRWWLWAAKEAAFKSARKQDDTVVFSPPRFEVALSSLEVGYVIHRQKTRRQRFEFRLQHGDGVVHAIANSRVGSGTGGARLIHGVRRLRPEEATSAAGIASTWGPSVAVREFACEQIATALGDSSQLLEVRKQGRVPVLWRAQRRVAADLSLSHHGDWVAFACWLDRSELVDAVEGPRVGEAYALRGCES